MNFQEFINKTLGKAIDVDGQYSCQCVDLFNYFNKLYNNGVYINCRPSGYARSIAQNKANNGLLNYYIETTVNNMIFGTVVVWGDCRIAPKSHVGFFLEDIENGDYQSAYDVLNEDFKKTYFTNLDEFKEYADKNFNSSIMTLTYDNVERLGNSKTGNMYVVWVTISNMFQSKLKDGEELPQTSFVIIEYDYNKYEMSFSVNQE